MSGHADVKRVSTKATEKHGSLFVIEVKLNVAPDYEWRKCFERPSTYQHNESHPSLVKIAGDELWFNSTEKNLEENIKWLDKYISQANECYHQKMAEITQKRKREQETEAKDKEEVERINKMLEKL